MAVEDIELSPVTKKKRAERQVKEEKAPLLSNVVVQSEPALEDKLKFKVKFPLLSLFLPSLFLLPYTFFPLFIFFSPSPPEEKEVFTQIFRWEE